MSPEKVSGEIPDPHLQERKKPLQKITLDDIPERVLAEVKERAFRMQRKPAVYVRIVLEYAERPENRSKYRQLLSPSAKIYSTGKISHEKLHVPLVSTEFLKCLIEWAPYGLKVKREIAMAILIRHLDLIKHW